MSDYVLQRIIAKKMQAGKNYYRIKWQGWSSKDNTWQPEQHIPLHLITQFEEEDALNRAERQKKQKAKQLKKLYYPQNLALEKEILDHIRDNSQGLLFKVRIGDRVYELSRQEMLEKHSQLLCQYYVGLARAQGKY